MSNTVTDNPLHPSHYSTVPFNGIHVMVVDAGTKITDERSGEELTVTDHTAAQKGNTLFCTKRTFDALKAAIPKSPDEEPKATPSAQQVDQPA